jgi:hypothetical protein
MKIIIQGTSAEIRESLKGLIDEKRLGEFLSTSGEDSAIELRQSIDDPEIWRFYESISWETFHLMDLIVTKSHNTNEKGAWLSMEELTSIPLGDGTRLTEKQVSARVGGAVRVATRMDIEPPIKYRYSKADSEKRVYVEDAALATHEQYLETHRREYERFLEEQGFANPRDS